MDDLIPTRVRPVRDIEGRVWRSVSRLVVSMFVTDRRAWHSVTTTDMAASLAGLSHEWRAKDDEHIDGLLSMRMLSDRHLLQRLNVWVVGVHVPPCLIAKAYVAALLLQLTQHPRLQPLLIKQRKRARRAHLNSGVLSFATVIHVVAEISLKHIRLQARRLALVAICAIEDYADGGSNSLMPTCELFALVDSVCCKKNITSRKCGDQKTACFTYAHVSTLSLEG